MKEGPGPKKQLPACRMPRCPSGCGEAGRRLAEGGRRLCPHEEILEVVVSPSPLGLHLSAPLDPPP